MLDKKSVVMDCPCGTNKNELTQYFSEGETDFRLCRVCDCVFREKFPGSEELDKIYQEAYNDDSICEGNTNQESGDYALQSYGVYLLKNNIVSSGSKFLDYGAGSGLLVDEMLKKGVDANGIEFSASARDFCQQQRGFDIQENLSQYPDESFHTVTMIEVIEHLTELPETLGDIHRALKNNGLLFISTPNRNGIRARREKGYWREARKKFHLFLFSQKSLEYHLKQSGFSEIQRIIFSPLQKPGKIFAIYSRVMQLIGLSGTICVIARKR